MMKLALLPLLLFSLTPVYAANPREPCPAFTPLDDNFNWRWMDRDCHFRTRAELNHFLDNQNLWSKKYVDYLNDQAALAAHGAFRDPLRADLSGAHLGQADLAQARLDFANLAGAHLDGAHLAGADLVGADLTGADLDSYADLTGANLDGAQLKGARLDEAHLIDAHLRYADLTGAHLNDADLTGAELVGADLTGIADGSYYVDLTGADLTGAHLVGAHLEFAKLAGSRLFDADLTDAHLNDADLTGAFLTKADLTGADLNNADLSGASLDLADLTDAHLIYADLTGAGLSKADLTGVHLISADLTGSYLDHADLSNSDLRGTDLSDADLTLAKLWYADFEPKALPPLNIARAEGLQTLRWSESFDELGYRHKVEEARKPNSQMIMPPLPSLPERWILWLSRYREILQGGRKGWRDDFRFLWSDLFYGLQPHQPGTSQSKSRQTPTKTGEDTQPPASPGKESDKIPIVAQNEYSLIDLRNALNRAGYSEAELQLNLAYKRHTQSTLGMILYDWTCEYGLAPARPLVIALALALFAVPFYWLGIRQSWLGSQLLLVEKQGQEEIEIPLGGPLTRPGWRAQFSADPPSNQVRPEKLPERLRLWLVSNWLRLRRLVSSWQPRLRWEASFLKAIVLFSLIGIVNLGFEGLDFGRWVRNLTFREYDLKASGWLRTVSGIQSLVGLALLALSLLSFFGHRFE